MKIEHIKEKIKSFENANNPFYGFYITYMPYSNITSQKWGGINYLDEVLKEIETSENCIENELPIARLILYSKTDCLVFGKNQLWNPIDYESEYSHTATVVPYLAEGGWFGTVIPEAIFKSKQNE